MIESQEILSRISELRPELSKLFAMSLYELPDDIRSYYISDRPHPDATRHGYHFQLFLLRSSSFTWISLELYDQVVDKRHVHTVPLHRIRSVRSYSSATEAGSRMGCAIEFADFELDLPYEGDPRSSDDPASHRAFAFGQAIAEHL